MSLIDQLRNQANVVKEAQELEQQKAAKREQAYRQVIVPKLNGIVSYFTELFDHLNLVKPDIRASFKINGIGEMNNAQQRNYMISADSVANTRVVKATYECAAEAPITVSFSGKRQVEEQVRYLIENQIRFTHKVIPGNFRHEEQVECTIQPLIPISIVFEADIENSLIYMTCSNHENIGMWRRALSPGDITEAFCDELGRYMIRELASFRTTQLTDDIRKQLAEKVQAEKELRQIELDKAVHRMIEDDQKKVASQPRVFKLFKRSPSK